MTGNIAAVLIGGMLQLGSAHAQPAVRTQSATWAIAVKAADRYAAQPANQVSYWLGVRNITETPQVVCLLSLGYGLVSPDHGTGGTIDGLPFHPSPHSCRNPLSANLVLPGESLFFYAAIEVPDWARSDAELTFSVSLVELPSRQWVTLGVAAELPVRTK